MKTKALVVSAVILCFSVFVSAEGAREGTGNSSPILQREVRLIISGNAGSTQDQLIRAILPVLEDSLPFSVLVEYGIDSSRSPGDRYSWIAGNISKHVDKPSPDVHVFAAFEIPVVLAASPVSPVVSFPDIFLIPQDSSFLECPVTPGAMRRESTASPKLSHIHFRETEPVSALKAAIEARVPMMAALSVELTEVLRTGKLKALATFSSSPLRIEGYGTVPPVAYWEKGYSPKPDYFGILLPDTVSPEILEMLTEVWMKDIGGSGDLRAYAAERGLIFNPVVNPGETGMPSPR